MTYQLPYGMELGYAPPWAEEWGEDTRGIFAGFALGEIVYRFRWIPPGSFWMGSPEDEPGRDSDEGPRHLVRLTSGFWLGEVPCTQALWQEVMGENPSRFKSPDRPVEQVSWEDCQGFIKRLNERVDGLRARLPTEAQWEYACRAGTETATYAGPMEIVGSHNAPILDSIAWYGGNSGVDFELTDGSDSSWWSEKQVDHETAGTHPVAQREPNPWGLYDMLGNVYEWCADWQAPYSEEEVEDPQGPPKGDYRVFRGGSWLSDARHVRAAYRNWRKPSYRWDYLGFRLSRDQERSG